MFTAEMKIDTSSVNSSSVLLLIAVEGIIRTQFFFQESWVKCDAIQMQFYSNIFKEKVD